MAPTQEMLDEWNRREKELVDTDPNREPVLANLPDTDAVVAGTLTGKDFDRVAREGARTVPPRENGGNCDIKNLSKGSRIYFPVFVEGANFQSEIYISLKGWRNYLLWWYRNAGMD